MTLGRHKFFLTSPSLIEAERTDAGVTPRWMGPVEKNSFILVFVGLTKLNFRYSVSWQSGWLSGRASGYMHPGTSVLNKYFNLSYLSYCRHVPSDTMCHQ